MRATGLFGLLALAVGAIVVADIWTHPKGTQAAGNALISLEKNTGNQILGTPAK